MPEELFKIKYKVVTGNKNGRAWKGLRIIATSEVDGSVFKDMLFSDDEDETQYTDA